MQAAIYARVSTEKQGREQTIDSQLAALHQWVLQHQHTLGSEHVYTDEGYSGARLDRPGLDALRDAAIAGDFEVVAVFSPDRLARKYAYQVLLLEELRRAGCQVVFLQHPISEDPNDQLLLQIQGAVAEYERAVLSERFRRGKLQKARAGRWIGGKPPYGYRYVHRQEGVAGNMVPGYLVVDQAEADFVRMIYQWLVTEQMTIRQILKRLNAGPWQARCGKSIWSASVIHRILSDPLYTGTAYANRYRFVPPKKPRRPRGPHTAENSCRQPRPREEWIPIPVPPIVDQQTYDLAQAQLARNATLSFRNNTKYSYLLRCLLTCKTCGLAMFGRTHKATASQSVRSYYLCHGKDPILSARHEACPQRQVRVEELDTAVWGHVRALLEDPDRLLAQFQEFAQAAQMGDERQQADAHKLEAQLKRLTKEEGRLIDAYQAEVINLEELRERRGQLDIRRQGLRAQQEEQARQVREVAQSQQVLTDLRAFCERVRTRLGEVTLEEQQAILQLVIERVMVGEDTLEIRHVFPLRSTNGTNSTNVPPGAAGSEPLVAQLCSDSVLDTALALHTWELGGESI